MGFLDKILGGAAAQPIEAVGNVLDKLFTSKDEKLTHDEVLLRLAQEPNLAQVELNKVEAGHRSVFVAGWRPWIGWVCGIALFFYFVPQYVLASYLWAKMSLSLGELMPYPVGAEGLMELVIALLGLGALRTVEKSQGRAK